MEKITIVIPNYNGIRYLETCLASLDEQVQENAPSYEVLVVDNGSTDGSRELMAEKFPWVKTILLEENTGFCHAVNLGIQNSDAEYVLLLNNDTKAYPGFVQALYQAMKGRRKCFSVSAQMLMWDDPNYLDDAGDLYCALGWALGRGKGKPASQFDKAQQVFSACGGAALYRRSVFSEIGYFDENHFAYLEDLDIGYRARIYGYYNRYAPEAKVLHYGSATTGSRYNERKTELASANNVYVIYKNMPLLQLILNLPFLIPGFIIKALFFVKKGMGKKYLRGLWEGVRRCKSVEGRKNKIPFHVQHLPAYCSIQLQLWANCIKLLTER